MVLKRLSCRVNLPDKEEKEINSLSKEIREKIRERLREISKI